MLYIHVDTALEHVKLDFENYILSMCLVMCVILCYNVIAWFLMYVFIFYTYADIL
jgi:hypothetical protein